MPHYPAVCSSGSTTREPRELRARDDEAKLSCATCDAPAVLEYALGHKEHYGIWEADGARAQGAAQAEQVDPTLDRPPRSAALSRPRTVGEGAGGDGPRARRDRRRVASRDPVVLVRSTRGAALEGSRAALCGVAEEGTCTHGNSTTRLHVPAPSVATTAARGGDAGMVLPRSWSRPIARGPVSSARLFWDGGRVRYESGTHPRRAARRVPAALGASATLDRSGRSVGGGRRGAQRAILRAVRRPGSSGVRVGKTAGRSLSGTSGWVKRQFGRRMAEKDSIWLTEDGAM